MNIQESILLLRKVRAHCPSQKIDEYTPEAWAEALADMSYRDANDAVVWIVRQPLDLGRSRYIEPGHLIGALPQVRRNRRIQFGDIVTPPELQNSECYQQEHEYHRQVHRMITDGSLLPGQAQPTPAQLGITPKALPW